MTRIAKVYAKNELAGLLEETTDGEYRFTYEKKYLAETNLPPISLTLPKQAAPYHAKTLFPFFDGLIPEGWLLEIGIKNWKLNHRDRMGLLLHLCEDCIGSISIRADNP